VLPVRIENSTAGDASSIGERANHSIQAQNPSAAAAASKSDIFSRNSTEVRMSGALDYARIITVKPDSRA
jgi:hypothetical protein